MGTSEGGAIALEIAAQSDAAQRLAILGAGALSQKQELRLLFGTNTVEDAFERVKGNPQSITETVFGLPNRYWSSVLDKDPKRYVSRISAPTLIIIGENDQSVPVASARRANEMIATSRLIIWPEATHVFDAPKGNQRGEVFKTATAFLSGD